MYQVVISLLDQAFTQGPKKTETAKGVKITEKKKGIKVATASASGLFGPPWDLTANISKNKANSFTYDLTFTFDFPQAEGGKITYHIAGQWNKVDPPPHFPDDMSVTDWNIYYLGIKRTKQENTTIVDYGATPQDSAVSTLADVRKFIEKSKK